MNKINTKFHLEDKVKIIETANFKEKSEKNRLVYNTYKNRIGTVKGIRPINSKSITYIIEMTAKSGNIFTFDILEKYIQKHDDLVDDTVDVSVDDTVDVSVDDTVDVSVDDTVKHLLA